MQNLFSSNNLILGQGGLRPAVEIFDVSTTQFHRLIELSSGESVYCLDRSTDGRFIVAGTKRGFVYLFENTEQDAPKSNKLIQGAPVLSICFVDSRSFVSSDVAGRCLLWTLTKDIKCTRISGNQIISSLFKLDEFHLAAVGIDGNLLILDTENWQVTDIIDIPEAVEISALVKPLFWAKIRSWAWPSAGGKLTLLDPTDMTINLLSAHDKEFYATMLVRDKLITVGKEDCILKVWDLRGTKVEILKEYNLHHSAIAGTAWGHNKWKLLLLDSSGRTFIYCFDNDGPVFEKKYDDCNYRAINGLDINTYQFKAKVKIQQRARAICKDIETNLKNRCRNDMKSYYIELAELDFEHVSLIYQSEECSIKGDLTGQLKALKKLDEFVVKKELDLTCCLEGYAQLLERFQLPQKAIVIYEKLGRSDKLRELNSMLDLLDRQDYVIQSDIDVESLIGSASIMGQPFKGRYCLKQICLCVGLYVDIAAEEITGIYHKTCSNMPGHQLIQLKKLIWLSDHLNDDIETLIISGNNNEFSGIEFGIKIERVFMQSIITAVLIFNADVFNDHDKNNQQILAMFRKLKNSSTVKAWLSTVHKNINLTIRQLKGISIKANSQTGNII